VLPLNILMIWARFDRGRACKEAMACCKDLCCDPLQWLQWLFADHQPVWPKRPGSALLGSFQVAVGSVDMAQLCTLVIYALCSAHV
jgi:hypothetical protein